ASRLQPKLMSSCGRSETHGIAEPPSNNQPLVDDYEKLLGATSISMRPITSNILRAAARIRATTSIKTPDAIHAATALAVGCAQFITNDADYRKLRPLPVVLLKELV